MLTFITSLLALLVSTGETHPARESDTYELKIDLRNWSSVEALTVLPKPHGAFPAENGTQHVTLSCQQRYQVTVEGLDGRSFATVDRRARDCSDLAVVPVPRPLVTFAGHLRNQHLQVVKNARVLVTETNLLPMADAVTEFFPLAEEATLTDDAGNFFLLSQEAAFPLTLRLDAAEHVAEEVTVGSPRALSDLAVRTSRVVAGVVEGFSPAAELRLFVRCEYAPAGRRDCGFSSVDGDGSFLVEEVPTGTVRLSLALDDDTARGPFVDLGPNDHLASISYDRGATLRGLLVNSRTGESLENIGVMLVEPGSGQMISTVVTGTDGAFTANFLPRESVVLRVIDLAYFPKKLSVDLATTREVEIELDELKTARLDVRVTHRGEPVKGIGVKADDILTGRREVGTTGDDGVAMLEVVAASSIRVRADGAGWISAQRTVDLSAADNQTVELGVYSAARLSGTYIKRLCEGNPEVLLQYQGGRSLRARAGRGESFFFEGLDSGDALLLARCDGKRVFERAVSIEPGDVINLGLMTF